MTVNVKNIPKYRKIYENDSDAANLPTTHVQLEHNRFRAEKDRKFKSIRPDSPTLEGLGTYPATLPPPPGAKAPSRPVRAAPRPPTRLGAPPSTLVGV